MNPENGLFGSLFVAVIGSEAEDDVELGSELSCLGIENWGKLYHEMFGGFSETLDETILLVPLITGDKALSREGFFLAAIDPEVDVRGARAVGDGLDGAEVVAAIAGGHEAFEALEVVVALWSGEAAILAVDVGAFSIDLPDFDPGIRDGVAFDIGDFSVEVGDRAYAGGDRVVDADEVIVGIERELVGIKRTLGHRGRGREGFGKGSRHGEDSGRAKGSLTEEMPAVEIRVHWLG